MNKIINVIMPAFNCGKYLDHSVLSVFSQVTEHKIVLMVSNDCSSDNSKGVLDRLKSTFTRDNFEIRVYNQNLNLGEVKNTKFLLNECDGDYIAYIDADDFWITPNKLELQINFLEQNKDYSMCFTGYLDYNNGHFTPIEDGHCWLCPPNNIDINSPITPEMLTLTNFIGSSSRFFRNFKGIIIPDYIFDNFPYSDWPMNFEIALLGKIGYLNFPSYCYRIHDSSLTQKISLDKLETLDMLDNRIKILKEKLAIWNHSN